jgi:uncharacterized protein YjfI (DUF2170 family)
MPVSRAEAAAVLAETVKAWLADPENDVVYSEEVDGYLVIRMRQTVRDFTSVWFLVGERSIQIEAYVLPAPDDDHSAVFRQCLVRNRKAWRVHFMVGQDGGLVLHGRLANEVVNSSELSLLLAEIYDAVEVGFRPLIRAGWPTEPGREK